MSDKICRKDECAIEDGDENRVLTLIVGIEFLCLSGNPVCDLSVMDERLKLLAFYCDHWFVAELEFYAKLHKKSLFEGKIGKNTVKKRHSKCYFI